jgi:hypothetical protein
MKILLDRVSDVVDAARADYYRKYWIAGGVLLSLVAIMVISAIVHSRRKR